MVDSPGAPDDAKDNALDDSVLWSDTHESFAQQAREAIENDDLASALFAVDGWCMPTSAVDRAKQRLEGWAMAVRESETPALALEKVLVDMGDVTGDGEHYYDVENSRLAAVVMRGRGMPILLSAVWVLVGRKAGLSCEGIGMPGHFLARIDGDFVDPFHAGKTLEAEDLAALAKRFAPDEPFRTEWLDPVTPTAWLIRVLNNAANSWYRAGSTIDHYRQRRFARVVADSAHTWQAEGYAAMLLGAAHLAEEAWHTVVKRWPDSTYAADAVRRMADLRSEDIILN